MANTPSILDPRNLAFRDAHGAAVARNNLPFNPPPTHQYEDETALLTARDYVASNGLDHGHLVVERSGNGQHCWAAKIRGTTRWRSPSFNLASGKFKEGDIAPFKS